MILDVQKPLNEKAMQELNSRVEPGQAGAGEGGRGLPEGGGLHQVGRRSASLRAGIQAGPSGRAYRPRRMESVWDYPRPPRVEPCTVRARVELDGVTIADSTAALRVLETSQAPAIYFPPGDVAMEHLTPGRAPVAVRVEGPRVLLRRALGAAGGAGPTPTPCPGTPSCATTWPSTPSRWTRASWATSAWTPTRATSTAAGSRPDLVGPVQGRAGHAGLVVAGVTTPTVRTPVRAEGMGMERTLKDGTIVTVRPIRAGDKDALSDALDPPLPRLGPRPLPGPQVALLGLRAALPDRGGRPRPRGAGGRAGGVARARSPGSGAGCACPRRRTPPSSRSWSATRCRARAWAPSWPTTWWRWPRPTASPASPPRR